MVTPADIRDAASLIRPHVIRTPLVYSPTFSAMTGADVYLKLENLQKAGSFKVRGATNRILRIRDRIGPSGVVAASAGNHAQGVALAARQAGVPATIVMPESVSLGKEMATRAYGAEVVLKGTALAESLAAARELEKGGMTFIHPYDDPFVIAGQGTIALEILEDLPKTDVIIVPVGGGGLIAGIATAARDARPNVRIVGAETKACPAACEAKLKGECVTVVPGHSVADGILVTRLGTLPFPIMEDLVDEIVTVDEGSIVRAMLLLLERKKVIAEGAGAVPLAVLLEGAITISPGSTVVLVISGGNVDTPLLERIIRKGLISSGRTVRIAVLLDDVPGALAGLLRIVAEHHGNVLHIHHAREEPELPINALRVDLEVETRGAGHGEEIRAAIGAGGFQVFS
jgi:threonine dehydratase